MKIYEKRSDKDTNFTTAIAASGGAEEENLTGLTADNILIEGVAINSDQRLSWDVNFYTKDTFGDTDQDADYLCGMVSIANTAMKTNPSSASQYIGYYNTAPIPYLDADGTKELHIALVNRSGTNKTATTGGEVVVKVYYSERVNYT